MSNDLRYFGMVCKSSNGTFGVARKRVFDGEQWFWEGISFNGHYWRSRRPIVVARSINDYIRKFVCADKPVKEPIQESVKNVSVSEEELIDDLINFDTCQDAETV
jgi:hypothetical protein